MPHHSDPLMTEHKEALRLAWESLHVPIGTLLIGGLLASGIFSSVSMMWSY